jgi:hypothetical protein
MPTLTTVAGFVWCAVGTALVGWNLWLLWKRSRA